jgi:hypothetical protein
VTLEDAVEFFNTLSNEDVAKLKKLNSRIQKYDGKWGERKGGDKLPDGSTESYWIDNQSLIYEFFDFMNDKNLLPFYDWFNWNEGSDLFLLDEPNKYNSVGLETALKLLYAAKRKERFADGTLVWAFESGYFPKLINRLVTLSTDKY